MSNNLVKLFFIGQNETIIDAVPAKDSLSIHQSLSINKSDTLAVSLVLDQRYISELDDVRYFAISDRDNPDHNFWLYRKTNAKINNKSIDLTGVDAFYDDLKAYGYIKDKRPNDLNVSDVLDIILGDTRWNIDFVDPLLKSSTAETHDTSFYYQTYLDALTQAEGLWTFEIQPQVNVEGNKITRRYVNVYRQLGGNRGARFAYGSNALTIVKETNDTDVYTALIGRGAGVETTDATTGEATGGYSRKITFADEEWSIANGDPADKPKGQEWIELPAATKLYGYSDGTPRFGIADFDDEKDAKKLLQETWDALQTASIPAVQYSATVDSTGKFLYLGETVTISRKKLGMAYQTRVTELDWNRKDETKTKITLGDKLIQSAADRFKNVSDEAYRATVGVNEAKDQANFAINNAGTNIDWGVNEPSQPKEGDLWYRINSDGSITMLRYVDGVWVVAIDDTTGQQIKNKVDSAVATTQQARDSATSAVNSANAAIAKAGFASDTASAASQAATSAALTANTAAAGVITAKNDAANALTSAATAFNVANGARDSATSAVNSAASALDKVKNLQNGGRNYILNSNVNWTELFQHDIYLSQPLSFFVGKTITLSAQVDFDNAVVTGQSVHRIGFEMDTINNSMKNWLQVEDGDSYHGRIIITMSFSLETSKQTNVWVNGGIQGFTADNASVSDIQLEIGNLVSDYSQAPEDIQQQFTDINGELESKVSKDTYDVLAGTVNQTSTLAKQNQNALVSKADSSDVDVLKQRVTTAENTLTQTATKTELAQTKTDVDNINKSVQTNTSNITAQAGKIDGLLNTTSTLGNDYSTLENKFTASSGELSNSIKQVQTNVDALSNADINLYVGTKKFSNSNVWVGYSSWRKAEETYNGLTVMQTTTAWYGLGQYIPVKTGEVYTFSAYVRYLSGTGNSAIYWQLNGDPEEGHSTAYVDNVGQQISLSDVWQRCSATVTITKDGYIKPRVEHGISNSNTIQVAGLQLQKGAVATTYSQSPSDLATNTDLDNLSQQVSTNETNIDQNSKLIALKADESKVDTLTDTVTNNASKLSVMSDSINGLSTKTQSVGDQLTTLQGNFNLSSQQLTATMSKVDNMASGGGTNLITNSNVAVVLTRPDDNLNYPSWVGKKIFSGLTNGETYTFSALATITSANNSVKQWGIRIFQQTGNYEACRTTLDDGAGKRQSYTFTVPDDGKPYDVWVYAGIMGGGNATDKITVALTEYQLETGVVAHDWSPAPEDQATVTALTKVSQTAEGAEALATNNKGDIGDLVIKANGMQTNFTNQITGLQTKQTTLAGQYTSVASDLTNLSNSVQSQFTQTTQNMNLRVQKGDLLSQINIEAGQTLIQSNKLYLDAASVIFSGRAFINSAYITELSGSKISAGTVDANIVNLINLNGANISAYTITGDKLSANAVQVGFNNMGSTMKITPTDLTFYNGANRALVLNNTGMHIIATADNTDVGRIEANIMQDYPSLHGLTFDLNSQGDFMTWGAQNEGNSNDVYHTKLLWLRKSAATKMGNNALAGFDFSDPVRLSGGIDIAEAYQNLKFEVFTFSNTDYPALTSSNGKVGIAFGSTELYLIRNGTYYPLSGILKNTAYNV